MVFAGGVQLKKNNSIGNMVNTITGLNLWPGVVPVTEDNYNLWTKTWVVDCMREYRLGQSFCIFFGIPNSSPLYWFKDQNTSLRWIKENYLADGKQ
jgi:hypothetical protein